MRDFRTELTAGRCAENHGCNVAKTCMCDLAEAMLEEIERLQAALKRLEDELTEAFEWRADHDRREDCPWKCQINDPTCLCARPQGAQSKERP